jgi:hypothetical protein
MPRARSQMCDTFLPRALARAASFFLLGGLDGEEEWDCTATRA